MKPEAKKRNGDSFSERDLLWGNGIVLRGKDAANRRREHVTQHACHARAVELQSESDLPTRSKLAPFLPLSRTKTPCDLSPEERRGLELVALNVHMLSDLGVGLESLETTFAYDDRKQLNGTLETHCSRYFGRDVLREMSDLTEEYSAARVRQMKRGVLVTDGTTFGRTDCCAIYIRGICPQIGQVVHVFVGLVDLDSADATGHENGIKSLLRKRNLTAEVSLCGLVSDAAPVMCKTAEDLRRTFPNLIHLTDIAHMHDNAVKKIRTLDPVLIHGRKLRGWFATMSSSTKLQKTFCARLKNFFWGPVGGGSAPHPHPPPHLPCGKSPEKIFCLWHLYRKNIFFTCAT